MPLGKSAEQIRKTYYYDQYFQSNVCLGMSVYNMFCRL